MGYLLVEITDVIGWLLLCDDSHQYNIDSITNG